MQQYLNLLQKIIDRGHSHDDRTGVGRVSIFGEQMRFNMADGFPLVTTKQMFPNTVVSELLWFIRGSTSNAELNSANCHVWDKWALKMEDVVKIAEKYSNGDEETTNHIMSAGIDRLNSVGPMYGHAWRNAPQDIYHSLWPAVDMADIPKDKLESYKAEYEIWKTNKDDDCDVELTFEKFCDIMYRRTVDQLNELVIGLRDRPYSSRHVVSAWIPATIPFETLSPQENVLVEKGSLAPCHMMFQCFVTPSKSGHNKPRLSLMVVIRSQDSAAGYPYNVAQYALLLHMLAHVLDMRPHELIWTGGDVHLYTDQMEVAREQVTRNPLPLPTLWLNPEVKSIFDFTAEDIKFIDYQHHPKLDYPVAM